ncbi:transposable element Tcb2 transposase [Trichonephila clavipes]|nr:transposable element Tcb2 transposase [Trichonephila clavipes]
MQLLHRPAYLPDMSPIEHVWNLVGRPGSTPAPHGDESRFNCWDHDGRIRVRRYAVEHCLSKCVIERPSGLIPGVMASLELSFSRIMHAHMLQRLFETSIQDQHMQLLPWTAYSPDISPMEHVWDFVGRHLARDPRPAA